MKFSFKFRRQLFCECLIDYNKHRVQPIKLKSDHYEDIKEIEDEFSLDYLS